MDDKEITKSKLIGLYSIAFVISLMITLNIPNYNVFTYNLISTFIFISVIFLFSFKYNNTEIVDLSWSVVGCLLIIVNSKNISIKNVSTFMLDISLLILIVVYSVRHFLIYTRQIKVLNRKNLNFRYRELEDNFKNSRLVYWIFSYVFLHQFPLINLTLAYYPIFEIIEIIKNSKYYTFNILYIFLGYLLCYFAIIFETISDEQLHLFRNSKRDEIVMNKGLWKKIRHPNYLGEILYFLSLSILNYSFTGEISYNIAGFIIFTSLIIFYSIPAMEKHLLSKYKTEYEKYQKITYRLLPYIL